MPPRTRHPRPPRALGAALAAAAAAAGVAAAPPPAALAGQGADRLPPYRATVRLLTPAERADMTPGVWRRGCPVGLGALRHVSVPFVGFGGRPRRGALVVHSGAARDVVAVFRELYRARFPIRRMRPIQAYGGDDFRSIEADNTSAFNCRPATGSRRWSQHAYGRAIDLNPLENPYVSGGRTSHRRSVPYLDRSRARRGMIRDGGVVVRAFERRGWEWGGRWSGVRDYQHISADGG
ncbi:M15 family metallopeptidase [Miltoncostaea marina]|uniref:M15 family metallopeptidase n=1 Tax=Miltoncostaea marina TaxID=2843215 RepID=UPI001C3CAF64|nr:M15 family metallopeptidase [Miltoncostaea marina]